MSSTGSKRNRFSRRLEAAYCKGFEDGKSAELLKIAPAEAAKALKPFAADAEIYDGQGIDDGEKSFNDNITVGDLRRARNALAALCAQEDVAGWKPIDTAPTFPASTTTPASGAKSTPESTGGEHHAER